MALLKGKQIATGADGVGTTNLVDGVLAASAGGRAKIATAFFDEATVDSKFAAASVDDNILKNSYILADGTRAMAAALAMGSQKITGLADGTASTDAATYGQLQAQAAGLSWKEACLAATTQVIDDANTYANGTAGVGATITADANGAWDTVNSDGVTLIVGDRLLVKDETAGDAPNNGLYEVTDLGSAGTPWILTRVTDMDTTGEYDGGAVFVQQGATHADQGWVQTATVTTVGTTDVVWTQFTGAASIAFGTSVQGVTASTSNGGGSGTNAARDNHTHALSTATQSVAIQSDAGTATTGTAASVLRTDAQLTASTAAPGATQLGAAAGAGSATSLSRSDHVHKANTAAAALGAAAAIGTSQDIARADHVHKYLTRQVETVTTEAISNADTAMADTLDNTPIGAVAVFLNGMLQQEGATNDYTISGSTITWRASVTGSAVDQEATDEMLVIYHSA